MRQFTLTAAAALAMVVALPAAARTETFRGTLGGTKPPAMTHSPASGRAEVKVDLDKHRVSLDLEVTGITLAQLASTLKDQPAGPVQFHQVHGPGDVEIAMGVPFGASYRPTKDGFRVVLRDYDYDAGRKAVGGFLSIEEFATALRAGNVFLDVRTEKFPGGEISGETS